MANLELESKTIELKTSTLESITFSLMARDVADRLWSYLKMSHPEMDLKDDGDIFIKLRNDVRLETNLSESFEKDVHLPLFEKLMAAGLFMASLRSVGDQASASVDLTEKEIDYLNGLYLGRIEKTRNEIENPRVKEIMNIIEEARKSSRTPMNTFEESREIFMELNLSWNKAGGTPRPSFLEFNG